MLLSPLNMHAQNIKFPAFHFSFVCIFTDSRIVDLEKDLTVCNKNEDFNDFQNVQADNQLFKMAACIG